MPAGGHALTIERVKLVDPKLHGLSRWGDAEQRTTMRTGDLGANADFSRCLHDILDGDANIWEGRDDASDNGLEALGSRTLTRRQRDVLPVRDYRLVHRIGIVVTEGSIQSFHRVSFGAELFGSTDIGCRHLVVTPVGMAKFWVFA
jgi:hypothetical protein